MTDKNKALRVLSQYYGQMPRDDYDFLDEFIRQCQQKPAVGVEACAYWVRYPDGSGRIYEDKGEADHYAKRAWTTPEVIPVYRAAPPAPAAQDMNEELLEALKETTDLLEAAVMGDRVNTNRIDRVLERTEIAKAEAQKAGV